MTSKRSKVLIAAAIFGWGAISAVAGGIAMHNGYVSASIAIFRRVESTSWKTYPKYDERTSLFRNLPVSYGDVVMLGDSLTERAEWAELLGNSMVRNRGIGSDTVKGVSLRLKDIARMRPSTIFLMVGFNDLAFRSKPSQIASQYSVLLSNIRSLLPSVNLYVESILPISPQKYRGQVTNDEIVEVNNRLKSLATQYNCRFIDVAKILSDASGNLDKSLTVDGLHLTGNGYVKWAKVVKAYL